MSGFGEKSKKRSNITNKPSKEQIINQAFWFHSKGNISEAAKLYQYFINQGFNDHRVFSNYGAILQGLGKLLEAEFSYRKAIELKPDFADAYLNLGNVLKDLDKLQEAEFSYRKAIEIKPDKPDSYLKLGNILRDLGNLKESCLCFEEALKIDENFYQAKIGIGEILLINGKMKNGILKLKEAYGAINFNYKNSDIIIN